MVGVKQGVRGGMVRGRDWLGRFGRSSSLRGDWTMREWHGKASGFEGATDRAGAKKPRTWEDTKKVSEKQFGGGCQNWLECNRYH